VKVKWIHAENIKAKNVEKELGDLDGILVAPGFGDRGIEGKIHAIKYVRENNIPFFGICLGMQCAVIEFARNVIGLKKAHTTEIDENTKYPVIDIMEQQKKVINKGGTMRLGSFPCKIKNGSKTKKAYKQITTKERHRHRYEFNNTYLKDFEYAGMKATGVNPKSNLVEIIEIPKHPWFVGVQFHPEYKSTVSSPHPLFINFIEACLNQK
jgi:CTP synthase